MAKFGKITVDGEADDDDQTELGANTIIDDDPEMDSDPVDLDSDLDGGNDGGDENTENEVIVSIAGEEISAEEEEQAKAPAWVKDLRKSSREKDKKIRELEAKLQGTGQAAPKMVTLGPKPRLEDHDIDFDPEKFEVALSEWFDRKRQHDTNESRIMAEQDASQKAWQEKLDLYGRSKTELKVKDYDDAEAYVQERFSVTQQGIILQGLDNPALAVYALGKNPKKAAELAAITDPVKFAISIGKLESQLKITPRRTAPPPTKSISGNGPVSGAVDSTLNRLRAEAEKTGDYTKVVKYKAQKKA